MGFKKKSASLESLPNLSKISSEWLRELGVRTPEELKKQDLDVLYLTLRSRHHQVTRLMYYALWGAVRGVHWNLCPEKERQRVALL